MEILHVGMGSHEPLWMSKHMGNDKNGRKRTENISTVFVSIFLDRNRNGSGIDGSENGSGINGNMKTGKYDRKIDGNGR
jgi:hypothetical protein